MKATLAFVFCLGLAGMVMAGSPGPDDTGGIRLRGPDDPPTTPIAKPRALQAPNQRPVGAFTFVRNCDDERLPDYDPDAPSCNESVETAPTEITVEPPPVAVRPPVPLMMPCARAHCDD